MAWFHPDAESTPRFHRLVLDDAELQMVYEALRRTKPFQDIPGLRQKSVDLTRVVSEKADSLYVTEAD